MSAQLIQFGGSLLAICGLVIFANWLGFSRAAQLSGEQDARDQFLLAPGGFVPQNIAISEKCNSAIARGADGTLAVLRPHGGRFVVQRLARGNVARIQNGRLHIDTMPPIAFSLGSEAEIWARRIAAATSQ